MSLANKVAIVTGASSGIGAAIAVKFAEEGAQVAMVGRNKTKLANVAKSCEAVGAKPLVIVAELTNEEDAKRIVSDTVKQYGKLDVLVNNAAIVRLSNIVDADMMKHYDDTMATNLRAVVHLTHLAAPHLIETKGNIINISSVASTRVLMTGMSAYCASKAALDHFTRNVALELGPKGVRANIVNPGPVKSDIVQTIDPEKLKSFEDAMDMDKVTALGRMSEPEETAELVAFLACDKSKCVTGGSFFSDNGMALKVA